MDAAADAVPQGHQVCTSLHDFRRRLRDSVLPNTSDRHAAHVSLTFELPQAAALLPHEAHSESQPGTGSVPNDVPWQPTKQSSAASGTIQKSSDGDPVLERDVTNHIIRELGAVDGSSWVATKESKGPQGWVFKYICKDSLEHWNCENPRKARQPSIGTFSGKGCHDPTNLCESFKRA
jgi:hypothetical protein